MITTVLRDLIAYVVSELGDMEAGFGKTKLVKIIYLIDVEFYRLQRKTLSGLEWRFYHYGPYAFDIDTALRELDLDIPQEETMTKAGHRAFTFKPNRDMLGTTLAHVRPEQKMLLDRIISQWALEDLNKILDYVYFYTEPMLKATRGSVLDFSTVRRRLVLQQKQPSVGLAPERLEAFKRRFNEIKERGAQRLQKQLTPPPRFDAEYQKALHIREREERYSIPAGKVVLEENQKHDLSKLGERDLDD